MKRPEVLPDAVQINKPVDRAEQVISRHMPLQVKPVEERFLRDRLPAHHHDILFTQRRLNQALTMTATRPFSTQSTAS